MLQTSFHAEAQKDFDPAPSLASANKTKIVTAKAIPAGAPCIGVPVTTDGDIPKELGIDRTALTAMGFEGKVGQTLLYPAQGTTLIAFGIGPRAEVDAAKLRDGAATFANAGEAYEQLVILLNDTFIAAKMAAQAIVEGAILARYHYSLKRQATQPKPLKQLTLASTASEKDLKEGAELAGVLARATELARDLAAAPASLLTARRMAEIAESLAKECGLEVEIFDEKQLADMGCGGILGVNAGSVEPPSSRRA